MSSNLAPSPIRTNQTRLNGAIDNMWEEHIYPGLQYFIGIPNQSPQFDPEWEHNKLLTKAAEHMRDWSNQLGLTGMSIKLVCDPGHTPFLYVDIPGTTDQHILLYAHLDKQPPLKDWNEGRHPHEAQIQNNRCYGRGSVDDGYAFFSIMGCLRILQQLQLNHARCSIIVEASEESGSWDLEHYVKKFSNYIGQPNLFIGLDACCSDYERLWLTSSTRGTITGQLSIQTLDHSLHSGLYSGSVPQSMQILRTLLARVEHADTEEIHLRTLHCDIPQEETENIITSSQLLQHNKQPQHTYAHTQNLNSDPIQCLKRTFWHPSLTITGIDGLPPTGLAGNVITKKITCKLSLRIPPLVDTDAACHVLKTTLEQNPPYNASIEMTIDQATPGWHTKQHPTWLQQLCQHASVQAFQQDPAYLGSGGSIPFLPIIQKYFPNTPMLMTGIVGADSNPHSIDENFYIPALKKMMHSLCIILQGQPSLTKEMNQ